jgi:hypothetical protein
MRYVYLLESLAAPSERYVGTTCTCVNGWHSTTPANPATPQSSSRGGLSLTSRSGIPTKQRRSSGVKSGSVTLLRDGGSGER